MAVKVTIARRVAAGRPWNRYQGQKLVSWKLCFAFRLGSPPISTGRHCEWLVITMKGNKLWKLVSCLNVNGSI